MPRKIQTIEVEANVIDSAEVPSLYEQVTQWIEQKDWKYDCTEKQDYITFSVGLQDAAVRVSCWLYDSPDWRRLSVSTVFYTRVPAHRRSEVALALARINYLTSVGCFETDVDDGEVRTRTWHESEVAITEEMVDRVIRRSLELADQYQAPLLAVAFGNAPASQVIEMGKRSEQAVLQ
jgi:hypothetical protein